MKISTTTNQLSSLKADVLVMPVFESSTIASIDKNIAALVQGRVKWEEFSGKKNTSVIVQTPTDLPNIYLIGLGKPENLHSEEIIEIAAVAIRKTMSLKGTSVICFVPKEIADFDHAASHLVCGAFLGGYSFTAHKNITLEKNKKDITEFTLAYHELKTNIESEISYGETIASAVMFARDLINKSPSETPPTKLAEIAEELAQVHNDISCTILSKPEMEKLGMGGLLGIARGSSEEPKFIHLSYNGGGKKIITLVGKGITFDSGGLSIKPAQGMETMKLDMSGAAVVLAVFSILSKLHPDITVHGLISATENMVGPHAIKPGDVVSAMNGKTIEILNTDAEGRVVLADAMSYAAKNIKSDAIIDFATLTGACMIALGEDVAGLFSNNPELTQSLQTSAQRTGEKIWEMPLVEEYKEKLKSPVADIKNIGGKYGGAITGALFIGAFVPEQTPWAHVDIAGPSFNEKDTPVCPHGGTGFGIRMIVDYLLSQVR